MPIRNSSEVNNIIPPTHTVRAETISVSISTKSNFVFRLNYSASVEIIFHMISFSDRRNVSRIVIRLHYFGRYCSFGPFSYRIKRIHFLEVYIY